MSRTDKDVPDWYGVEYEAVHSCKEYGVSRKWWKAEGLCDLPELTYRNVRYDYSHRWHGYRCGWTPVRPKDRKRWYDDNPGWWYRQVWLEPERSRVRDQSTKALQDYNANGDTEVDIADFRRKHEGGWYW